MYYIGIDLGTSAVKLLLMDETGSIANIVSREYPIAFPHPGWSEQDPADWWAAVCDGIPALLDGFDASQVKGIGAGGQMHGLVVLDKNDAVIRPCILWNDGRTQRQVDYLNGVIGKDKLSCYTANIAFAGFTAPKLLWMRENEPDNFARIEKIMLPKDYLAYRLSGVAVNEYTNASTTAMVSAEHKTWDKEIIARVGLPEKIFGALHKPGEALGGLTERVKEKVGFDLTVRLAASHDTASAFLAVPAKDENAVFLSSGTWSIIGVELKAPVTNDESRAQNFTNEGGYEYRYRYLKNIMGLWMLQNMRQELGDENSFDKLTELAQSAADYKGRVDVNAECFLAPKSM